jgi:hypothetical protein
VANTTSDALNLPAEAGRRCILKVVRGARGAFEAELTQQERRLQEQEQNSVPKKVVIPDPWQYDLATEWRDAIRRKILHQNLDIDLLRIWLGEDPPFDNLGVFKGGSGF